MSGTVVFEDAKLQAVELIAETVTLNNFSVSTATTFQQTTNASNVTTNTLRFTNPATAFVTTGNVEVGGELTVGSNVEIGTANLFVDTTTGNVGVGTASPDSIFHTHSGAGADEVWVDQWKHSFDANWNFRLSQRHDHGNTVEYGFKQRYNTTEYSPITFRGSTMELSSNVGIGTVSPRCMLDIYTASTAIPGLIIDRHSSGTHRSELYQESDGLAIKVGDGTNAPTENMRITSSTTATPGKLTVGTGTASGSQMYVYAAGDGSTTANTDLHVTPNGTLTMYGTRPWITTTNGQGHYDKLCSLSLYTAGHQPAIEWIRNNSQGTNQRNWLLRQETDDYLYMWHYNGTAWSVPFVFNKDGKFGVGTTTPGVQLHIQGTSPRTLSTSNGPSFSDYGQLVITDTTAPSGTGTLGNLKIGYDASTGSFGTGFLQCVNPNVYSGPLALQPYGGNVGIGTSDPAYTIDVNGTIGVSGKQVYPMLRWEIDLTSQSNSNFYPIEFTHPASEGTPDLPDLHPIHFKVFGESLSGSDPYNENTLVGYAKGGGWSDHGPMYDVHIRRYTPGEHRFQGLYEGNGGAYQQFVIYMRGGYRYSAITDATSVVTHTSAYTVPNSGGATFAIKNSSGTDVSGTSSGIGFLVNLAANARHSERFTSGDFKIDGNVDANGVIKNQNPTWSVYKGSTGGNNSGILQYNSNRCTPVNVTLNTVVVNGLTYFYRATITVAGRYFVGFQGFADPGQNGSGHEIYISKNGTNMVRNYMNAPTNNYNTHGGLGVVLDLAVNDYLEIYSGGTMHHNHNCSFYGFMIG